VVDALGNPLRLRLTAGQYPDITQADALLADFACDYVIADRGYAAQPFLEAIAAQGAIPVIPPHQCRKQPCAYDPWLYRERHLVECFINKNKHYRRIFTRFDKLASRYLGFVQFASTLIWIR